MLEFDGTKLKELRKEKKLKQKDVALIVGKQTSHIWNYENGHGTPPSDVLLNLMNFFNVAPHQIGKPKQN